MKLMPAASPGMRAAHKHPYVQTVVKLLLQDRNLLRLGANFLRDNTPGNLQDFEKNLEGLRRSLDRRLDVSGPVGASGHASELIETLQNLYRQDQEKINYQRGAIVELLVYKLVCHRYNEPGEFCLNNQRFFVDNYTVITVEEVDVAALSNPRQKVEGYECKTSVGGFGSFDCINLGDLVKAAKERNYRSHVGFVSFDNDRKVKLRLDTLKRNGHQFSPFIKPYGLDSIESLEHLPYLEK